MKEVYGDLWDLAEGYVVCVTTNGQTKTGGLAVMGRGIAAEAAGRFPGIAKDLGTLLDQYGNRVYNLGPRTRNDVLGHQEYDAVVSFPTKTHWRYNSELALIEQSAKQLVEMADSNCWNNVFLTRPGCGNGGLEWDAVKTVIGPLFDDRFIIVERPPKYAQQKTVMTLECSSKGDDRFSAFGAVVEVLGKRDLIERHYQLAKRFGNFVPSTIKEAKGKKPTHFELGGKSFDVKYLSAYYSLMWVKYLDAHPELVAYARQFDEFTDMFRGKSVNCQADCVRDYVKHGRQSIMGRPDVVEFCALLKGAK